MSLALTEPTTIDTRQLDRELDRAKSRVFLSSNAGFLGPLMCYMNFVWDEAVGTAAVDGATYWWAPSYFSSLPFESRQTEIMHELWHVARLHMIRRGTRDPHLWNVACDIKIDLTLKDEGYCFDKIPTVLLNPALDKPAYRDMAEEEIYDDLVKSSFKPKQERQDMRPEPSSQAKQDMINNVVQAANAARMAGQGGHIPGEIQATLTQFLAPVIAWQTVLHRFMQELSNTDFSWQVRDRRFADIYMPGEIEDDGRLDHLMYFLDVSGSVTDAQVVRFNSEVKHIKDVYNPKKLTLAQFDTKITSVKTFLEEDRFEEIVVIGRGGTYWHPVKAYIEEHKPTAAIIFTDLGFADRITTLDHEIPTIWVAIDNRSTPVPFGELIHIKA